MVIRPKRRQRPLSVSLGRRADPFFKGGVGGRGLSSDVISWPSLELKSLVAFGC
jgi:hypothetical protein